ncbi:hypothetical protein DFAR_1800009 [Desulfarculales bacterium]
MLPGRYLSQFPNQAEALPVEVVAGQMIALDLSKGASAH